MTRELPPTSRAQLYRKILGVVWVMSISGITLTLSSFVSALMDVGFDLAQFAWNESLLTAILLLTWSLVCWFAYRGNRRNLMPPTWGIVVVVALMWAGLLLNRLA